MFFSKDSKRNKLIKRIAKNRLTPFAINDIFPDENLAKVVAEKLGVDTTNKHQTLDTLGTITILDADGKGIESLEGIEFLNNLRYADFSENSIKKLPDYTKSEMNLYRNKDTLVFCDLSNNPFLDPKRLFSREAGTNRAKFFEVFEAYPSRFGFGEYQDRLYPKGQINPRLIQIAIERFIPKNIDNKEVLINEILLKYILAKKIFYNKDIYNKQFILQDGKIQFNTSLINPLYLNEEGRQLASALIEDILPEEDLYLIRTLVNQTQNINPEDTNLEQINRGSTIERMLNYYSHNTDKLTPEFVLTDNGYEPKSDYSSLRSSGLTSHEEAILSAIKDEDVKKEYSRYLDYKEILDDYQKNHPDLQRDIQKTLRRANEFTSGYLSQYLSLQDNTLLSDDQRKVLEDARNSFKKYVDNFVNQARVYFDQEIFGLEVEMKYIDMLAEADRKFS